MRCLRFWRSWIRPLVICAFALLLCVVLPLIIVEFQVKGIEKHLQAWFIGGFFVLMAIPISIWGIIQHMIHYTQPFLQRHIIRILWMIPIYALTAWLGLRFTTIAIYLDTIRECYEAYVIYNFMTYLLNFLRSGYPNLEETLAAKPQVRHPPPCCRLPPWIMGRPLIDNCRHGVLQYVVIRPVTTMIALICQLTGSYHEGQFDFRYAWVYIALINNVSQVFALYCLVLFYRATKEELAPIKPVAKFLCVKAVVFLSFWQGFLLAILVSVGAIKAVETQWITYSPNDIATSLQDFCICVEMFFAAIAHYFSFTHKPFIDYAAGYANCCDSFWHMWDVSDVRDDVVDHVRHVGKRATGIVTRPFRGRATRVSTDERTPLLEDESSTPPTLLINESGNSEQAEADTEETFEKRPLDDTSSTQTFESVMGLSDSFHTKPFTASMNNYVRFEDSTSASEQNTTDVSCDQKLPHATCSEAINTNGRDVSGAQTGTTCSEAINTNGRDDSGAQTGTTYSEANNTNGRDDSGAQTGTTYSGAVNTNGRDDSGAQTGTTYSEAINTNGRDDSGAQTGTTSGTVPEEGATQSDSTQDKIEDLIEI